MSNIKVDYRQPTEADICELIQDLAPEDRVELLAQGVSVDYAVRSSVRNSTECVSILVDGRLTCITGVSADVGLGGTVFPWLLAKPLMQDYPRECLRISRLLIQRWLGRYPYMTNYVDARHLRAVRWLRHLGAELIHIPQHGIYKREFYQFTFGSPE